MILYILKVKQQAIPLFQPKMVLLKEMYFVKQERIFIPQISLKLTIRIIKQPLVVQLKPEMLMKRS